MSTADAGKRGRRRPSHLDEEEGDEELGLHSYYYSKAPTYKVMQPPVSPSGSRRGANSATPHGRRCPCLDEGGDAPPTVKASHNLQDRLNKWLEDVESFTQITAPSLAAMETTIDTLSQNKEEGVGGLRKGAGDKKGSTIATSPAYRKEDFMRPGPPNMEDDGRELRSSIKRPVKEGQSFSPKPKKTVIISGVNKNEVSQLSSSEGGPSLLSRQHTGHNTSREEEEEEEGGRLKKREKGGKKKDVIMDTLAKNYPASGGQGKEELCDCCHACPCRCLYCREKKRRKSSSEPQGKKPPSSAVSPEALLRERFVKLCNCYWSLFCNPTGEANEGSTTTTSKKKELEMSINPAAHTKECPCYQQEASYLETMEAMRRWERGRRGGSAVGSSRSTSRHSKQTIDLSSDCSTSLRRSRKGEEVRVVMTERGEEDGKAQDSHKAGKHTPSAVFGTSKRSTLFVDPSEYTREEPKKEKTSSGKRNKVSPAKDTAPSEEEKGKEDEKEEEKDVITPEKRQKKKIPTPGPGDYNLAHTIQFMRGRSPQAFIPTSRHSADTTSGVMVRKTLKKKKEKEHAPGSPSDRSTTPQKGKPKLQYELVEEILPTPGPGAYGPTPTIDQEILQEKERIKSIQQLLAPEDAADTGSTETKKKSKKKKKKRVPDTNIQSKLQKLCQNATFRLTSKRNLFFDKGVASFPSPQDYHVVEQEDILYPAPRKTVFGTAPRRNPYFIDADKVKEMEEKEETCSCPDQEGDGGEREDEEEQEVIITREVMEEVEHEVVDEETGEKKTVFLPTKKLVQEKQRVKGKSNNKKKNNKKGGPGSEKKRKIHRKSCPYYYKSHPSALPGPSDYIVVTGKEVGANLHQAPNFKLINYRPRKEKTNDPDHLSPGPADYHAWESYQATVIPNPASAIVTSSRKQMMKEIELLYHADPKATTDCQYYYSPEVDTFVNTVKYKRAPAYPFGTAPRMPFNIDDKAFYEGTEKSPVGPAAYVPVYTTQESAAPSAVFGTARRNDIITDHEYYYNVHLSQTGGDGKDRVGPGDYDVERYYQYHHQRNPFPHAPSAVPPPKRVLYLDEILKEKQDLPGPMTYHLTEPTTTTAGGVTFSTAPRDPQGQREAHKGPGPGQYEVPAAPSGPKGIPFSTAPRLDRDRAAEEESGKVGPGAYDPPRPPPTHQGFTFGTGGDPPEEEEEVPGPGQYEPYYEERLKYSRAPAALIGRTSGRTPSPDEVAVRENIPGPGYYSVERDPRYETHRGATFPTAPREAGPREEEAVPGPGQYEVYRRPSGPRGVPFATAPRSTPTAEEAVPGPGHYEGRPPSRTGGGVSFPTAPREVADRPEEAAPGPGHYEIYHSDSSPSHRFPTAPRQEVPTGDPDIPGPGQYEGHQQRHPASGVVVFPKAPRFQPDEGDKEKGEIPGPGHYITMEQAYHLGHIPAAVFGSSPKAAPAVTDDHPGPGYYSLTVKPEGPSYKFGTAPTEGNREADSSSPGPGYYHVEPKSRGKGVSFPTAPREEGKDPAEDAVPGPGYYQLPTQRDGPSYKFGTAPVEFTTTPAGDDGVPGPGYYHTDASKDKKGGGVPFSTAPRLERDKRGEEIPGPGYYSVVPPKEGPSHKFGTAPTEVNRNADAEVPGPGYYNVEKRAEKGGVTFPTAPRENGEGRSADEVPGPGYYNLTMKPDGPSYKFGTAPTDTVNPNQESPGPGYYQTEAPRRLPQGVTFTTAPRQESHATPDAPGPGYYNLTLKPDGPSHKFGTAPTEISRPTREEGPGPGYYNLEQREGKVHGVGFPTAPREGAKSYDNEVPGPGYYSLTVKPEGPSHKFGTAPTEVQREAVQSDEPGPGYYNVERRAEKSGVAFPIAPRALELNDNKGNDIPGPGYYNLTMKPDGPSYKFGTAPTDTVNPNQESPGPGYYQTEAPRRLPQGVTFTTAPRQESHATPDAPGPGYYNLTLKPDGPSHKFGTAPTEISRPTREEGPGPGYYNLEQREGKVHGVGFPTAPREGAKSYDNEVPGPGYYNLTVKPEGPSHKFGTAPTEVQREAVQSDEPGPGYYNVERRAEKSGVAFPTAPRATHEKPSEVPGPGYYMVDRQPQGPSHTFGTATVAAAESHSPDLPGPGYYSADLGYEYLQKGPSFTITGPAAPPAAQTELTPGPGYYDAPAPARGPAFSIHGTASRYPEGPVDDQPGPGYYSVAPPAVGPVYTFPVTSHLTLPEPQYTDIGPGTYYRENLGQPNEAPAFSFPHTTHLHSPAAGAAATKDFPGPGTYYRPNQDPSGPSFSFPTTTHLTPSRPSLSPGPGLYHSSAASLGSAPSYTFPKAPTNYLHLDDQPGPGHYHRNTYGEHDSKDGILFTRAERFPSFPEAPQRKPSTSAPTASKEPASPFKTSEKSTLEKLRKAGYPVL